ncbi:MAG: hypothetical protein VX777_05845 [Chlamydiota bacterium]|nr:hypothetical protein [Chlamydiota bacterium]
MMVNTIISHALSARPNFSETPPIKFNSSHREQQKLLKASVRSCNLNGVKLALANGATPDPRLIDQAITRWRQSTLEIHHHTKTSLFLNISFLSIVNLLQDSLPKVSAESLEYLHKAFRLAYYSGESHEIFKNNTTETKGGASFGIISRSIEFTETEYSMISHLFPTIRLIFKEKMSQQWIEAPKLKSELSVEKFSINMNYCHPSFPCQHFCKITLSNGKQVERSLNGKEILYLIKGIPHSKHRHQIDIEEEEINEYYGPEAYYNHFNRYDSLEATPQLAENTLKEMFETRVQVSTNDKYFKLLRSGKLNTPEKLYAKLMRKEQFLKKIIVCCSEVLEQVKEAEAKNSAPLEKIENRLLRTFYFLHLKNLKEEIDILEQSAEIYKLKRGMIKKLKIILKRNNIEVDYDNNDQFLAYLTDRRSKEVLFCQHPLPSDYQGTTPESTKQFEIALTNYLS